MRGLSVRDGLHQQLLARSDSRLAAEARRTGVPVRDVPWRGAVDPAALRALVRECSTDWDVVHAHDGHAVQAVLAARALGGGRARVVASRRVDFATRRPDLWRKADLIIAVSGGIRDVLLGQGIERRRIAVVHSGVDPQAVHPDPSEDIRARAGAGPDELLVAAVGALVPHKDHGTFVRAASILTRDGLDVRYAVYGEGPERERLTRLIRAEGLEDRFVLAGQVPDIAGRLAALDIFVMSSRQEGLGTACVEAMQVGLPIASTSAGGLADLAAAGAFSPVPPEDAVALADSIRRLALDPAARRAAARAAAAAAPSFSTEKMVRGTLRCYRVLAAQRAAW